MTNTFEGNRVVRDTGCRFPIFNAPVGYFARAQPRRRGVGGRRHGADGDELGRASTRPPPSSTSCAPAPTRRSGCRCSCACSRARAASTRSSTGSSTGAPRCVVDLRRRPDADRRAGPRGRRQALPPGRQPQRRPPGRRRRRRRAHRRGRRERRPARRAVTAPVRPAAAGPGRGRRADHRRRRDRRRPRDGRRVRPRRRGRADGHPVHELGREPGARQLEAGHHRLRRHAEHRSGHARQSGCASSATSWPRPCSAATSTPPATPTPDRSSRRSSTAGSTRRWSAPASRPR